MVDKNFELLRYVSEHSKKQGDELVSVFEAAGLRTPEHFGDEAATPTPERISVAMAKVEAVSAALRLANIDFDAIFAAIQSRMNWRSNFKTMSAVIGAIASSSLIAMLGSESASMPWSLVTAVIALLASVATVIADRLGLSDKEFWEKLAEASRLKADSSVIQARLAALTSSGASEDEANNFVARAWEIVESLMRLNADLRTRQVEEK